MKYIMPMSEDFKERRERFLKYIGDQSAVEFVELVFDLVDMWDALIDKDEPITDDQIHNTFFKSLIDLPGNSFYQKHYMILAPQLMLTINSWLDANELQKGNENDRVFACGLRFGWIQIIPTVVNLVKGTDAAREISVNIWRDITSDEDAIGWVKGGN
jgi:hypothetical protein